MSKLIGYIIESQRNCPRIWTFTIKTPSRELSLRRKKLLFDPYFNRKEWEAEILRGVKSPSAANRRHVFLSIFINCNAPLIRYRSFRQSLTYYRRWLHRESRWYNFWYSRIRPWTAQILAGVTFYIIAQFGMLLVLWLSYHYKRRSWVPFVNFLWSVLCKTVLVFVVSILYVCLETFVNLLIFGVAFACYMLLYSGLVKLTVWAGSIFYPNLVYEKGVLCSNRYNYKYGMGNSSMAVRPTFRIDWRLVGDLNIRYAKVLERFEGYQFPFRRQDDELYLTFLAVRGVGWLKFEGPLSRVGFYSSFFPHSLLSNYFRLYKWRELALPLKWVRRWGFGRYPGVGSDYFYAKNIILDTKFTERLNFKSHNRFYEELVLYFISVSSALHKIKPISPFTVRAYPWWFYRSQYLSILFVKMYTFKFFSLVRNIVPFWGDIFKLVWRWRRRRRRRRSRANHIYAFGYSFFFVRPGSRRWHMFNGSSKMFLSSRLVFQSQWLRIKLFWGSFCWAVLYPIRFFFRRVFFVKVILFFFVIQYLLFSYPNSLAVILKATNLFI